MSANGSSPRVVNNAVKRKYTFKKLSKYVSEDLTKDVADNISGSSAAASAASSSAPCSSNQDSNITQLLPLPYAVKVENATKKKRFVATTTENIAAIKERRFEVSTVKSTHWGVKIFKEWLKENDININFETLLPNELDSLLARFYVEARKVDDDFYSKVSLSGIRASLQRHLQNPHGM